MKRSRKKSMLPFEWIFAMIAGAFILLVAVYGVVKAMEGGEGTSNKYVAEKIKAYLDPFETGLSTGESAEIIFRKESKIYIDDCSYLENSPFGQEVISFSEKTIGNRFGKKSEDTLVKNKYIFADTEITGKDMYILSKPFFMGYKVADIIVIGTEGHCFYQAPSEIKDELERLNIKKFIFSEDIENCSDYPIVCFDSNNAKCDITVYGECIDDCQTPYDYGKVVKKESGKNIELKYLNNLWIGAIFSSQDIYECNVKRYLNKFNELGKIYIEKNKLIQIKGCGENIEGRLSLAMKTSAQTETSADLLNLAPQIEDIRILNEATTTGCRLFY